MANSTMTTTNIKVQENAIELLRKQLRSAQIQQNWKAVERIERKLLELSSQQ